MNNFYLLAELQTICKEYWNKIARLENDKYDLEVIEQFKNLEVTGQPTSSYFKILFVYYYYFN